MDTYDQVKMLMKVGVGRPPIEPNIPALLNLLTVINEDIGGVVKDAKREGDLTRQDNVEIEGDVMSLILGCEEWLRRRYEDQFKGKTLSEESVDRLTSQMVLKRIMNKQGKDSK